MKHASYDPGCGVCRANNGESEVPGGTIFENDLWLMRHSPPPHVLPGWMMFHPQRHVQGPAHFTDDEAANFGLALRHVSKTLEEVTGALRIYTVAFGESFPHMHAHLVPRYVEMPDGATAWNIADLFRAVSAGERPAAAEQDVLQVIERFRQALSDSPPPR